jgi:hypothetical protein
MCHLLRSSPGPRARVGREAPFVAAACGETDQRRRVRLRAAIALAPRLETSPAASGRGQGLAGMSARKAEEEREYATPPRRTRVVRFPSGPVPSRSASFVLTRATCGFPIPHRWLAAAVVTGAVRAREPGHASSLGMRNMPTPQPTGRPLTTTAEESERTRWWCGGPLLVHAVSCRASLPTTTFPSGLCLPPPAFGPTCRLRETA